jgi:hypothetical protein
MRRSRMLCWGVAIGFIVGATLVRLLYHDLTR